MTRQRAPGVYFERGDPSPRRVAMVRTDIAGFVGVAERGPLHVPVKVESWTQFQTRFGEMIPEGFLAYAVKGFFANDGQSCWVVRVGALSPKRQRAALELVNQDGEPVFRVEARDDGKGSENISVRVERATEGRFNLLIRVKGETREIWRELSPDERDPRGRYACSEVNSKRESDPRDMAVELEREADGSGSVLVVLHDSAPAFTRDRMPVGVGTRDQPEGHLTGATDELAGLTLNHFTGEQDHQPPGFMFGLRTLELIDEVALVCIPDLAWPGTSVPRRPPPPPPRCYMLNAAPSASSVAAGKWGGLEPEDQQRGRQAMIRHCANMRDRFAILDAPAVMKPDKLMDKCVVTRPNELVDKCVKELRSEAGQFAAIYYPWIYVPEPLLGENVRLVPPSGHVAGMYARVDRAVGVQKPPANETLAEVRGVEVELDAIVHGFLNDEGVNAIRPYPGRGVRVMGARTLVPPNAPDLRPWRFVNVRRLVMMIEESIDQSTQWLVFEPNRVDKQRELDRVVRIFLDEQWRAGRLDGASAEEAFSVTCDETSNPPEEVDAGRMTCVIGLQPPDPAEFVFVRLGRRIGETGVLAFDGGVNG